MVSADYVLVLALSVIVTVCQLLVQYMSGGIFVHGFGIITFLVISKQSWQYVLE